MSYNTRRSGTGYAGNLNMNTRPTGNRGGMQQNFVAGGQFQPTAKPLVQMPVRHPQPTFHQPQNPLPPAPLKSALKKEVKVEGAMTDSQLIGVLQDSKTLSPTTTNPTVQKSTEPMEQSATDDPDGTGLDEESTNGEKKPFWRHIKTGKISKKEKRGRRNQRLRKILQPKNALMVLNELVGGQKFNIVEKSTNPAPGETAGTFIATVIIDGQEFVGYGKNKTLAKSAAAETALKQIIVAKLKPSTKASSTTSSVDGDGDITMDETKGEEDDVSWLHIASYAIHKLFISWDSDGVLAEQLQAEIKSPLPSKPVPKKPAKQLPANAELMNPVMLLNQMRPGTTYEDVGKDGNPPAISFTVKTICDGEEFLGKGNNKKVARKNCAYAACSKVFEINYPAEDFTESVNN